MLQLASRVKSKEEGAIPNLYKRITQFEPDDEMHTHGTLLPLNVDLSDDSAAKTTVLPIDLIDDAIDTAAFIGKMDKCICRSAHHCEHYPAGHGCLFLNMAGVTAVKNGLAREVAKEEAHAHVRAAQELGLVGQALYVELEQLIWGFRNDKMDEFFEICFCCPCCCMAMGLAKNASREIKNRFAPSGFTAVIDHDKCVGCGACHLDVPMLTPALDLIDLPATDGVFVENIGNLACPAEFDLGAGIDAMILSVPEGHDKILKYPLMFSMCDVLIVNKCDKAHRAAQAHRLVGATVSARRGALER